MASINAPPDEPAEPIEVLLACEKNNRAAAFSGWGPTIRLWFVRIRVAPRIFLTAGGGGIFAILATLLFNSIR